MLFTFLKQEYNFLCNDLIGYYESIHDLTVRRTEVVNSERSNFILSVGVRQGCPFKRLLYLQKLFKKLTSIDKIHFQIGGCVTLQKGIYAIDID